MPDVIEFEMDPESNWDICPVCLGFLSNQEEFPGRERMRSHHEAHKTRALVVAREHDASFGDKLPDHYQAQWDRRNLLQIIDDQQREAGRVDG